MHLAWNRATPCVIGLPRFVCVFQTRLGYLGSETTLAKLLPVGFGLLAFICRDALEAFARSAPFPRVVLDCIEQRHSLGALIRLGRCSAIHQGHPAPVGEAVDEAPYAFPPVRDALAATLARGKKRRLRRPTPSESCHLLRQCPESGLASQPGFHRPASVATSAT